jgi:hypothetical protein
MIFFFNAQQTLVGQGLLIFEDGRSHSETPHSVESSGRAISPTQKPILDNTQHLEAMDIHVAGGTRSDKTQQAKGSRLTPETVWPPRSAFIHYVVCLFSWRYNPLWLYFHSLVAGFSLHIFKVSWSHTTTCHSR